MTRTNGELSAGLRPTSKGPLALLADLFSSVWFGITLLALIFLYSSLDGFVLFIYWALGIDGGQLLRQRPGIELTEFEWFHWWPFNLMMAMLAANLITVTVRRIPLKLINAGVWMIHTGILILIAGSAWYFGTKVEGDAPVYRRRAIIQVPGVPEPATMLIRPGNAITVGQGANAYSFRVSQTDPDWPILSEPDKGKKAYGVMIAVQGPKGNFVRQLLAGYPQYTEDILPDRGRAVKAIGTPLVDTELQMALDYEPQTHFYVVDSQALYIREAGASQWIERPIDRPVRYNEHLSSRDDVWIPPGIDIPLRKLDTPIRAIAENDPMKTVSMRATGYLPYAQERVRWLDDGERLNPVVSATLQVEGSPTRSFELVAFDAQQSTAANGAVSFRWVDSAEQIDALMADREKQASTSPRLTITIPGTDIRLEHAISEVSVENQTLPFTTVPGTEYSFRVQNAYGQLRIPQGEFEGRQISVAVIEVRSSKGPYIRWVSNPSEFTRDFPADGTPMGHDPIALDEGIKMAYEPGALPAREDDSGLIIAAGPGDIGLHVKLNASGVRERHPVEIGKTLSMSNGQLKLTIDSLQTRARAQLRPMIVPLSSRDREMKDMLSMLKVELNDGRTTQSIWLPYNPYPLANEQYSYPGRMFYQPKQIRLSDGRAYELMFSRRRMELPYPVALENFELEQHVGGYTGSAATIRNYVSKLRFTNGDGWTDPLPISVNSPTEFGGYWYFQSQWDPPSPQTRSSGFNYTGLGVGNRNGVHVQLVGCAIAVTGMIFAFYVKPILKRRRQQAVRASVAAQQKAGGGRKDASLVRESLLAPTAAGIHSRKMDESS